MNKNHEDRMNELAEEKCFELAVYDTMSEQEKLEAFESYTAMFKLCHDLMIEDMKKLLEVTWPKKNLKLIEVKK